MDAVIAAPFFEFGPKTYLDRSALLDSAEAAGESSVRYGVAVIITPPVMSIEAVNSQTPELCVFAHAMDNLPVGCSTGAVLLEALRAIGADRVLLNHAERPLHSRLLRRRCCAPRQPNCSRSSLFRSPARRCDTRAGPRTSSSPSRTI